VARSLDQVIARLPPKRRAKIEQRASELATLKDLREAVERTQEELAARLGVGQDTVSRIERRSDILLSTLRRYVEAMGGDLQLVARFPNRAPLVIDHIAAKASAHAKQRAPAKRSKSAARRSSLSERTKEGARARQGSARQ
jgi:transcriptional regulator with XRE-family HTH domain